RFANVTATEAISVAVHDESCVMINRNQGSGTRILIDQHLSGRRPNGYAVQAKNHNAVIAAIEQHRADWGIAIESVADHPSIRFLPLQDEHFDFAVPKDRINRPAIAAFCALLQESSDK
ncbi:MAG: hypothetical protein KDB27_31650, partial [Planctomycetales bacterium]|nr:hypothetical protein [Planctomycetales bacterium]